MTQAPLTKDRILSCAHTLIMAGGYGSFSYADIADLVGIRKPSIHHHFPSKVDLVRALLVHHRQRVQAGIDDLERRSDDPLQQLEGYVAHWSACIGDDSTPFCVCALLASQLPVLPGEVAAEVKAHFRALSAWLASVLERGLKRGQLTLPDTPRTEADAFVATVHGAMLSARANDNPKLFASIVTPLIHRLTARQGLPASGLPPLACRPPVA